MQIRKVTYYKQKLTSENYICIYMYSVSLTVWHYELSGRELEMICSWFCSSMIMYDLDESDTMINKLNVFRSRAVFLCKLTEIDFVN